MKNPMQLKAIVKNIAEEKNISAKQIRGYFFFINKMIPRQRNMNLINSPRTKDTKYEID